MFIDSVSLKTNKSEVPDQGTAHDSKMFPIAT